MGVHIQLADSFWLRAIQDFDFCDQPINTTECQGKSWLFQLIDLTTELDKIFLEAYFYGGLALTIIISDYEGATKIFDKGTIQFPNEWPLNYVAGYHAMIEEKDDIKASRRYLAAANNGAPSWVRILAGRLAAQGGDTEFAEKILEQMIEISEKPEWIARLKTKLAEVKSKNK